MPALYQCLRYANRNHQHTKIIEIPDGDARHCRSRQRPKLRKDQQVGNHKQYRPKTDAVTREIAAPCHGRHGSEDNAIGRHLNAFVLGRRKEIGNDWRGQEYCGG